MTTTPDIDRSGLMPSPNSDMADNHELASLQFGATSALNIWTHVQRNADLYDHDQISEAEQDALSAMERLINYVRAGA